MFIITRLTEQILQRSEKMPFNPILWVATVAFWSSTCTATPDPALNLTAVEAARDNTLFGLSNVNVSTPPPADPYINWDQQTHTYFKAFNFRPPVVASDTGAWVGYLLTLVWYQDVNTGFPLYL